MTETRQHLDLSLSDGLYAGGTKCLLSLKLLIKIKMARLEGTNLTFFEKLAKTVLLILGDFGLTTFGQQHCLDLMELTEDRHARRATIIASQLPVASWYD